MHAWVPLHTIAQRDVHFPDVSCTNMDTAGTCIFINTFGGHRFWNCAHSLQFSIKQCLLKEGGFALLCKLPNVWFSREMFVEVWRKSLLYSFNYGYSQEMIRLRGESAFSESRPNSVKLECEGGREDGLFDSIKYRKETLRPCQRWGLHQFSWNPRVGQSYFALRVTYFGLI